MRPDSFCWLVGWPVCVLLFPQALLLCHGAICSSPGSMPALQLPALSVVSSMHPFPNAAWGGAEPNPISSMTPFRAPFLGCSAPGSHSTERWTQRSSALIGCRICIEPQLGISTGRGWAE
ncbi:uncharacterized protein B0T15DRAFT_13286 [Chaetomium strumarium]|uniref:Secreted protein n=1 Tax=Chaetomium strumarium TaxID=1170767 RepID=A0AAJ0H0T0_9PEZI|nr:hypothetical protein B0T15DRAFT_13286 [Chaetomium strumarium]